MYGSVKEPADHWRLDDHVDEVRLRLWTAATNGPIVHPPDDMWVWRATVEWCRQRGNSWFVYQNSQAILPAESSRSKQEDRAKRMMNLTLWRIFLHTCKLFLTCRKISRCEASGFTSFPNEVVQRIFIALKNPSLYAGFEPANLGSNGKHAISPLRRHGILGVVVNSWLGSFQVRFFS
jgi:hypothetical protein